MSEYNPIDVEQKVSEIGKEMLIQNKRATSWVYFVIVEDKKIYNVDPTDGIRERKSADAIDDVGDMFCESCLKRDDNGDDLPDDCDDCDEECFGYYRIEQHVPNLEHGIFFTAKACEDYIKSFPYRLDKSAQSYGMSGHNSDELRYVMAHLVGAKSAHLLT